LAATSGNSPEAIALCDALDTFIEANIDEGLESHVEQAYLDLVAAINTVRFFSRC
jgi:hypothetical protein